MRDRIPPVRALIEPIHRCPFVCRLVGGVCRCFFWCRFALGRALAVRTQPRAYVASARYRRQVIDLLQQPERFQAFENAEAECGAADPASGECEANKIFPDPLFDFAAGRYFDDFIVKHGVPCARFLGTHSYSPISRRATCILANEFCQLRVPLFVGAFPRDESTFGSANGPVATDV